MALKDDLIDTPSLSPIRKRHWWVLNEEWSYQDIYIPAGFTTDLDSIPHIPIVFALYKGRSRVAALIHDYLYSIGDRPRKECDRLFLYYMIDDDIPNWIAYSMYAAVRSFGWRYYQRSLGECSEERLRNRLIDNSGVSPFLIEQNITVP